MAPPPAKKARHVVLAEELTKGAVVLYKDGQKGVVRDAYGPLDEFWVADQKTNELVRGDDGDICSFSAKELQLPRAPDHGRTRDQKGDGVGSGVRVLLLASEAHMVEILLNFGAVDTAERKEPSQQLLAVPLGSCGCGPRCTRFDPWSKGMCDTATCPLYGVTCDAVEEGLWELAEKERPGIEMNVRPYHLKQAMQDVGKHTAGLDGFYTLASVTLPYGSEKIDESQGWEKRWLEHIHCQIDIGVSGDGVREQQDKSFVDAAIRILAESAGVRLCEDLWTEAVQLQLRKALNVKGLPLKLNDGPGTKVIVLLLPEDATSEDDDGVLTFEADVHVPRAPSPSIEEASRAPAVGDDGKEKMSKLRLEKYSKMSIKDWAANQEEFEDLPKLLPGWIRCRSKKTGEIYYWDERNSKPQFEFPLPPGWTKNTSKSTGKVYYFHAAKRQSSFELPTE